MQRRHYRSQADASAVIAAIQTELDAQGPGAVGVSGLPEAGELLLARKGAAVVASP